MSHPPADEWSGLRTLTLSVAALGVVFGDIGTSPLYALRESLGGEHEMAISDANVLGVLSLIFWSLVVVVTIKYLVVVMRADNDGEGGILALTALVGAAAPPRRPPTTSAVKRTVRRASGRAGALVLLGLFGTALLYGDGMITPAISVLAAVEGIEVAAPGVHDFVPWIAIGILVGIFSIQRRGTGTVGALFGPVMIVWFTTLGLLGVRHLLDDPSVLRALNPWYAAQFFADNGGRGFLVLGSVFLVVTGGEALYADMGHFGRRPIQYAWYVVALPALLLNYFGQGALLLGRPDAIENPFYLLAPGWAQWPLTLLATAATIIASQALITGAFSLTVQAINLDYLPRMRVVQTSSASRGQVYVPAINWFLLVACVALVLGFGSSSRLAAAYGVAVTLTMVITTLLVGRLARHGWGWPAWKVAIVIVPLLAVDTAFAAANVFKIPAGGWLPLVVGVAGFVVLTTWFTGRRLVGERIQRRGLAIDRFVASVARSGVDRHPGTGIYLHRSPGLVPPALLANLRHNASLHDDVVLLCVLTSDQPHVPPAARDRIVHHGAGFHELRLTYGFVDQPDLQRDLAALTGVGVSFDPDHCTYFLGRERLAVTNLPGMAPWRERLFEFLHRNAGDPAAHFGLPAARSVDIGTHVEL